MDPFHSGLLVLAVFVGNLTIKPATTPLIRWLGFRRLLLINGALNVCSLWLARCLRRRRRSGPSC
ncbi:putative MFS-family transport protein [Klebsiella pneumoniae]|uniref:Putative MFS-family transport protein n=1 Tax=Klebsiella pneumoniae TaxID=573 RepID=A0A378AA57_KLEPN|nr:putative MFS-family transport protein [Klebsiella pneumoniae]